jgi:hypothetical protein
VIEPVQNIFPLTDMVLYNIIIREDQMHDRYELVRADSIKALMAAVNARAARGVKLVCVFTSTQGIGVSAIIDTLQEGE